VNQLHLSLSPSCSLPLSRSRLSPSPLILQSWIDLTTVDIQKRLCTLFDYSLSEENEDLLDEVEDQIEASFENLALTSSKAPDFFDTYNSISPRRTGSFSGRLRTSSFSERLRATSFSMEPQAPTPNYRSRANSISRANSLCRTSSMDYSAAAADDLLTPLRKRIERQLAEQKMKQNLNLSAGLSSPLSSSQPNLSWCLFSSAVTQNIRDLQILIANNICNSIYSGRPILRGVDTSPTKNYAELLTSHLGWEVFLEVSLASDSCFFCSCCSSSHFSCPLAAWLPYRIP
jgi:hypothetical protein